MLKQMTAICKGKQAEINQSFVINWTSKKRDKQIEKLIEDISDELY